MSPDAERLGHSLGDFAHFRERGHDARFAASVRAEHGVDRFAGDAALTRVDHDAASLELGARLRAEWNVAHVDAIARKAQAERAAVCGGVVILSPTGNTEVTDLDRSAEFGELGTLHRLARVPPPARRRSLRPRPMSRPIPRPPENRSARRCARSPTGIVAPPRGRSTDRRPTSTRSPARRPRRSCA